jgi:hypothetical protein
VQSSPEAGAPTSKIEAPAIDLAASKSTSSRPLAVPSTLFVTTTILGKTRRAAIVNGRLYRQGDKIASGTELYRLSGVAEDRIELVSLGTGAKRSVLLKATLKPNGDLSKSR